MWAGRQGEARVIHAKSSAPHAKQRFGQPTRDRTQNRRQPERMGPEDHSDRGLRGVEGRGESSVEERDARGLEIGRAHV